MHLIPKLVPDDRRVLGLVPQLFVTQLAKVGPVVQQFVDEPFIKKW